MRRTAPRASDDRPGSNDKSAALARQDEPAEVPAIDATRDEAQHDQLG
jgi:hypothetical protein